MVNLGAEGVNYDSRAPRLKGRDKREYWSDQLWWFDKLIIGISRHNTFDEGLGFGSRIRIDFLVLDSKEKKSNYTNMNL